MGGIFKLIGAMAEGVDEHTRGFFIGCLKTGKLPNHVAFIMDGNRRYASGKGKHISFGHQAGAATLLQIIDSSLKLGISHLSMYAFSIENFNRSPEEVSMLFELLMERLNQFLDLNDENKRNARIRIIGNKSYIPNDTLEKLERIEKLTASNQLITLNICFAYTSRDEIAHSIQKSIEIAEVDKYNPELTSDSFLDSHLYFPADTPPLDLLIRTSGHTRLSDFMLWQIGPSCDIVFTSILWPAFTVYHYYHQLLKYSYKREVDLKIHKLFDNYSVNHKETKKISIYNLPKPPPFVTVTGQLS